MPGPTLVLLSTDTLVMWQSSSMVFLSMKSLVKTLFSRKTLTFLIALFLVLCRGNLPPCLYSQKHLCPISTLTQLSWTLQKWKEWNEMKWNLLSWDKSEWIFNGNIETIKVKNFCETSVFLNYLLFHRFTNWADCSSLGGNGWKDTFNYKCVSF